jgi:predicted transcriptional regulator
VDVAKTFEVHVPDELASRIEHAASARGVSVEQLVKISVEEMIEREAQFESATARVLEKNAELYRRLS